MNPALRFAPLVLCCALPLSGAGPLDDPAPQKRPPEKSPQEKGPQEKGPQEKGPQEKGPQEKTPRGRANHLAGESSPYLLQHAYNPVDWRPWGEEALALARKEGKLIFLSVGYSSCHWCHVMERESFLDKEIAALLNEHFICIKVDREERPDIDTIYMTALHLFNRLSGSSRGGGWPMSMFLTPDAAPFFGGTYFPSRDGDRGVATGFLTVIKRLAEVWKESPDKIQADSKLLARYVKLELETARRAPGFEPNAKWIERVHADLAEQFDPEHGGFSFDPQQPQLPKFPEPANLVFLLQQAERPDSPRRDAALKMATVTLDHMARGGIRDHLGGGFHRYSVDRFWHIPHFEKMLYDNGQLATVYSAAHRLTGDDEYRRVVEELVAFLLRELTSPEGAFYAALDAESEDEEGKFYRWQREEIRQTLGDEQYRLFAPAYGIERPPNFDEFYAPQLAGPKSAAAEPLKLTVAQWEERLGPIRATLLAARDKRPRPLTDTKILAGWNGLMIRGLADAAHDLDKPEYAAAAERAADFVLTRLRDDQGRLRRTYGKQGARLTAYLDDHAYLVHGLLGLHRATGKQRWLDEARRLTEDQIKHFWNDGGGFFFTPDDHESLLARSRSQVDGALPSANSLSALNLVTLAGLLKHDDYRRRARETILSVSALLDSSPSASPYMALAVQALLDEAP